MNPTLRVIPILLFAALCLVSPRALADLQLGPYLQSLSADRVAVCVGTDPNDTVQITLSNPEAPKGDALPASDGIRCTAFAGLLPDMQYDYSVQVNGSQAGEGRFLAQSATEHVLIIFGDTRSGDDSFDLAHRRIVKTILQTQYAEAYIHTGDYVERGEDLLLWENFFTIEKDLLRNLPLYPSLGRSDQPPELIQRFFPLVRDKGYYSFDRGTAHIAVLRLWRSADQPSSLTSPEGEQARWLNEDLLSARARGAKHLFVIMHEPAFDVAGSIPRAVEQTFMPLFERHHVTAVFGGAHYFSHKLRHGVQYFTNGGGGAVLETAPPAPGMFRFFSAIHHFLVLEVGYFGARLRAVNAQGEEFYSVTFDESVSKAPGMESPVETQSVGQGGNKPVNLTVFYDSKSSPKDELLSLVKKATSNAAVSALVSFRSLDVADNRKLRRLQDPDDGPLPLLLLDQAKLNGKDQLVERLVPLLKSHAAMTQDTGLPLGRILVGVVVIVGALVFLAFFLLRKKRRT